MLQQTTVATVKPRFNAFLKRWPDVVSLARASLDDVLHEWQGFGYYARARNLHKCARMVTQQLDGRFPDNETALRNLPGVGDYTAAAVAAIAFGEKTTPVDGNIIRVLSRLYAIQDVMPKGKPVVADLLATLVPVDRPGDFAQALMDLGAGVCRSKKPDCALCPLQSCCLAFEAGDPEAYPKKPRRKRKPTRYGLVYWMSNSAGEVYLQQRPPSGLLGGMMEFPSTEWQETALPVDDLLKNAPLSHVDWKCIPGQVRHTFTHFHLTLSVARATVSDPAWGGNGYWIEPRNFGDHALPSLMKKVASHVAKAISDSA